jgi:hypothetical protein
LRSKAQRQIDFRLFSFLYLYAAHATGVPYTLGDGLQHGLPNHLLIHADLPLLALAWSERLQAEGGGAAQETSASRPSSSKASSTDTSSPGRLLSTDTLIRNPFLLLLLPSSTDETLTCMHEHNDTMHASRLYSWMIYEPIDRQSLL